MHSDWNLCFSPNIQHFQRDIVRGVEGYIVTGSKQVEIGNSLKILSGLIFL